MDSHEHGTTADDEATGQGIARGDWDEIPVDLRFELGELRMPVGQLKAIQPGYVFELEAPAERPVTIRANRVRIAIGRLVRIDAFGIPGAPRVILTPGYNRLNERTAVSAETPAGPEFRNAYVYDSLGRVSRIDQTGQAGGAAVAPKRVDIDYAVTGGIGTISRYADAAGTQPVAATASAGRAIVSAVRCPCESQYAACSSAFSRSPTR